jgi:hypothetical protein
MLLFNRFQLSKHNGWINGNGEVFVIYTRKELSERLNVSEKRISSAMNELKDYALVWERRCGRSFANQIYLANVKTALEDSMMSKGGPLDPAAAVATDEANDTRKATVKPEVTDVPKINAPADEYPDEPRPDETAVLNSPPSSSPAEASSEDPQDSRFKNLQNGSSRNADMAVQEPPNLPPSYIDLNKKDLSHLESSQSRSSPSVLRKDTDGQTDADTLNALIEQAELDTLEAEDAAVIRDAIERLFYSQNIKVGNAVYPNDRIRSNLQRLNSFIVQDAVTKITGNVTVKIRNSSAYVVSVLFNTIMESGSDLLVDPYLNCMRAACKPQTTGNGGG